MGFFPSFASPESKSSEAFVEVFVTMTPIGSFVARSEEISGLVHRHEDRFEARSVELKLASLKSGIAMRDRHMVKSYLDTGRHPKAIVKDAKGTGGAFTGTLILKAVARKIQGTYEFDGERIIAKFVIKPSDFSIALAAYLGMGVEDEVRVTAQLPTQSVPTVK